ncbi:hydrogenase maturation protease [Robiginitalea marina]|uniref:Hydrogenase maturation protease n=1 Tax=Robiginitalea marina TaxID=2954105 RepID=A0ABT1ATK4_9FLAO|nr:hydrogenase maturation protease [Robiginitalea marina]MCO5723271.1 hydrogenase maturation protease [Robiginitalea marina]
MKSILLVGIGNTGRGDDGLGWAFADRLLEDERFEVVRRYQLQVEDAELISRYKQVWFVDASHKAVRNGFSSERLRGQGQFSFTTHSLHPEAVLQLCHQLYGQRPQTQLLGISGEDFELGHGLSEAARERLEKAHAHFMEEVGSD